MIVRYHELVGRFTVGDGETVVLIVLDESDDLEFVFLFVGRFDYERVA